MKYLLNARFGGQAETADLRAKFESIVSSWQKENPRLAPQISDEKFDLFWQRISGNNTSTSTKRARDSDNPQQRRAQELSKRQNVTSSALTAARSMVADAIVQQGKINELTLSNPRRNVYTKKPSGSTTQADFSSLSSLLTANSSLASALPIIAEADAAILAQQGKLYKGYTLPGKFAKYNLPGTPSGSQHDKRDANDWFLPVLADNAPGTLPFGGNNSAIWRNVLYYGAKGDGIHDDTAAINFALSDGCGQGCNGSTTRGAVVYLPPGKIYLPSFRDDWQLIYLVRNIPR
jgi:hypothetical protein